MKGREETQLKSGASAADRNVNYWSGRGGDEPIRFGFLLVPIFGYIIICFASPLAWLLADAFLIPAFFNCQKHLLSEKTRMD